MGILECSCVSSAPRPSPVGQIVLTANVMKTAAIKQRTVRCLKPLLRARQALKANWLCCLPAKATAGGTDFRV